jgi:hypothetical protein
LLSLLAMWLLGLTLIAWPLLYLLLQSYVPQWPGVMCIFGVTQIGSGSMGISRWLPSLVSATQWLKPMAIFVSGAWLVLYRIYRAAPQGVLLRRVLLAELMLGMLVLADAAIEGAYLVIPKQEEFLFTGCCTSGNPTRTSSATSILQLGQRTATWISGTYYAANLILLACLWSVRSHCRVRQRASRMGIGLVLLSVIAALPITHAYFVEVATPTILRLPYHHCLYDLIPRAPDMVVAIVLYLGGCAAVGWAGIVRWLSDSSSSTSPAWPVFDGLLTASLNCLGAAFVLTFLDVHLA